MQGLGNLIQFMQQQNLSQESGDEESYDDYDPYGIADY